MKEAGLGAGIGNWNGADWDAGNECSSRRRAFASAEILSSQE